MMVETVHPRVIRKRQYQEIIRKAEAEDRANFKEGKITQYRVAVIRHLILNDLFFLLVYALNRVDMDRDWLFERCVEVQNDPDECLDVWAREHYKSTIITYGYTIQCVLKNPELTVGIFSHTRPTAVKFLEQIKYEFESNELLKMCFPDILWSDPEKQAPCWSLDRGITLHRRSNPKEATIEAHGVVKGQPTGRHFNILVYDDIVTLESVTTPTQITKTTDALRLSFNLGADGGARRFIGTRYHLNDTYSTLIKDKVVKHRKYAATKDGTPDGEPVLLSRKKLKEKRRDMGPFIFSCQMLNDPKADGAMGFDLSWIQYWHRREWEHLNRYIIVDPSSGRRAIEGKNDFTTMWVIGLGADRNYYVLDCVRDRLSLTGRTTALISLHQRWQPLGVGYEEYGIQADREHIEYVQNEKNYRFTITPLGGPVPKNNRILSLVPIFEQGRIYFPHTIMYTDYEGNTKNLVQVFIDEEYYPFPVLAHDDAFDCLARITDTNSKNWDMVWPVIQTQPIRMTAAEKDFAQITDEYRVGGHNID